MEFVNNFLLLGSPIRRWIDRWRRPPYTKK